MRTLTPLRSRQAPASHSLTDDVAEAMDSGRFGDGQLVIALEPDATRTLARSLRRVGLRPLTVSEWGQETGYEALLARPGTLAILDAPRSYHLETLADQVRALCLVTAVTVLAPPGTNSPSLLDAGAANVLSRALPTAELAARIGADQRWYAETAERAAGPVAHTCAPASAENGHQRSQQILLDVISRRYRPVCCHNLRRLLGSPSRPLTLPALRGRMLRVEPRLAQRGLSLQTSSSWGREIYRVVPGRAVA